MSHLLDRMTVHFDIYGAMYTFYMGLMLSIITSLEERARLKAVILGVIALNWCLYYESIFGYFKHLGVDSLSETAEFGWDEARFFLSTFYAQVKPDINGKHVIFYTSLSLILWGMIRRAKINAKEAKKIKSISILRPLSILLMVGGLVASLAGVFADMYTNSKSYISTREAFKYPNFDATAKRDINVLVYIGESTSIMNMSLYGYIRDTSPKLRNMASASDELLIFKNIFSTHTHTSPSLLEAMSIGESSIDQLQPIERRSRMSIVDVLRLAGVTTELVSNQGASGTWNQAGAIIFRNADLRTYSHSEKYLGNADNRVAKPWDHEFYHHELPVAKLNTKNKSLTVFHSNAGHGPYLERIPPSFRGRVDDMYTNMSYKAISGEINAKKYIEEYDSAIKYIDFSVFSAIESVRSSTRPWIFIYFADHGEAAFANRGHDSSRFTHEMLRVPYIVYFNDIAKEKYPDLYKKYVNLSKSYSVSTLAQFSATLLELFDISIPNKLMEGGVIGSGAPVSPILVREVREKKYHIDLNETALRSFESFPYDNATMNFILSKTRDDIEPVYCYHRTNTIATILRARLVSKCIEFDLHVDEQGKLDINHFPAEKTGLEVDRFCETACWER